MRDSCETIRKLEGFSLVFKNKPQVLVFELKANDQSTTGCGNGNNS